MENTNSESTSRRLLVVANRLPVNVSVNEDGTIKTEKASGGLVSGLQGLLKSVEFLWFGWPGADIHKNDKDKVTEQLRSEFSAIPIFLNQDIVESHYNGFSSGSHPCFDLLAIF